MDELDSSKHLEFIDFYELPRKMTETIEKNGRFLARQNIGTGQTDLNFGNCDIEYCMFCSA